ncbi:magnesium transporter [Caloranaerobacter sp. DY30410]|uniref:magnesium transporter n=1 Tax=Caloranaerobacter sp. DY30410 TaxID=3238305 RepID=UPI003D0588FA
MKERITKLINEKRYVEAKKEVTKLNVVDIAELLEELDKNSYLILFRILPKDMAAEVFSYLSYEQQRYIIDSITDKEIKNIVDELFFDDMIDIIEEMPANVVKKILKNTKEEERLLINQFLNYPENSAGSLMTIEYVDLKKEMTVKEAIEHIKKTGVDKETIYTCYVTDKNRKLEGLVSLRKLVISDDDKTVDEIMERDIIYVNTHDDQEEIAYLFKKYDLMAIPVVDKEGRLTGIITIDDIVDVIEQENTEDFQKMAAMSPSEEEYLETSTLSLAKHRITWLLILMISATFTGSIIRRFEEVLQSVVILAAYIPMLMDTGGNAGAQASTLIIRGMALGEIEIKDILKVIWKELRVSTVVGVILSLVNFMRIYFIDKVSLKVAITVCSTLFFTVVLAKIVGAMLPIGARKLKLDPAIMASPLITTIVDAVALILYFSMASWIMGL